MDEWRSSPLGGTCRRKLKGAVLAIGNFDGVHRGHQAVLGRARDLAIAEGTRSGAVVFEPHPREFFAPDTALLPPDAAAGEARAARGARARPDLRHRLRAGACRLERRDLRHRGRGQGARRRAMSWSATTSPTARAAPARRTSSRRSAASSASASTWWSRWRATAWRSPRAAFASISARARWARPPSSSAIGGACGARSSAAPAAARGSASPPSISSSAKGRTCATASTPCASTHKGRCYPAAGYVGARPTFGGDEPVLEAYLLDFAGDLYGEEVEVEFIELLRPDATFADGESLADPDAPRLCAGRAASSPCSQAATRCARFPLGRALSGGTGL